MTDNTANSGEKHRHWRSVFARLCDYYFGELDSDERARIEQLLAIDPHWQQQWHVLQDIVNGLRESREEYEPPGDLVPRTLQCIERASGEVAILTAVPQHPTRWLDVACGISVAVLMFLLFFPAVLNSRELSRRSFCQENLRRLGLAMEAYTEQFGCLPFIPEQGPLSFAGFIPVVLRDIRLIDSDHVVLCPSAPQPSAVFVLPRVNELLAVHGEQLLRLRQMAGGHFAYNLGVVDGGRYGSARREGRAWFAWASDAPLHPDRIPPYHGGRGFNVLFEDGRVQFVCSYCAPGTDEHLLRNRRGWIAAGVEKDDVVLGSSQVSPRPYRY